MFHYVLFSLLVYPDFIFCYSKIDLWPISDATKTVAAKMLMAKGPRSDAIIILILQMRLLRHREIT